MTIDDRVALVDTDGFAGGTNLRILDLGGIDPVVGPRVVDHSATTRNPTVDVDAGAPIFRDGFESGDTSAW